MTAPSRVRPAETGHSAFTRRTLVKGAAWATPVAAFSLSAPAMAASCPQGWVTTIGRGKALSGELFSANLDVLASVDGVIASAPGTVRESPGFKHGPQGEGDPDLHHDPLSVELLSTIPVEATGVSTLLSTILSGLTPANVGAVNQFATADSAGTSIGASGYVDDGGTVRTGEGNGYPEMGTLDLKTLLTPLLSGAGATFLADNVAGLSLDIGAVAGRAETEWSCSTESVLALDRDYLLSHLRLQIDSALVSGLSNIISQVVVGLNVPLVGGLEVDANVLVDGPLPSGSTQPIQADLKAGRVTVDLGTLFGGDDFGANYSQWLNGREANTLLFVDTPLPSAAITNFLSGLISGLQTRLLDAVSLELTVLGLGVFSGTINQLLANSLIGRALLTPLINAINRLFAAAGPLRSALDLVSTLLSNVFDWLEGVVNLRINAQNLPGDNVPALPALGAGPARWESLPSGRYDVAALGVSAVENVGVLDLYLGRGSVGPTTKA